MSELSPTTPESALDEPLLDTFLREGLPEVKLRLGDEIDRDNQRAIPDRFARLLPGSLLVITLRPDVAAAVADIAAELERELTDSVMRHGSLYDREYRVKLRVANAAGAALFRVSVRRDNEPEPEPFVPPRPEPPAPTPASAPARPPAGDVEGATVAAPAPRRPEPAFDPDATRLEGAGALAPEPPDWDAERWVLVVEDEEGEERERCAVPAPISTVGRQTDNAELRSDVSITDAPHVSRRQLVLEWAPRGNDTGFTVYNVGLNALHVGETEVAGANRGKGDLRLDELAAHTDWVAAGEPMRVGEHGPVLRLVDTRPPPEPEPEPVADEVPSDPDATVLG